MPVGHGGEGQTRDVSVAAKVGFLRRPSSYPEPATTVQVIETHMSWVFVTDTRVYKMKKPVRLPFLDFSTLERRRYYCETSVRLNRRLAADVYLGVVPLTVDRSGALELNGSGRPVEWLERMRRLPRERMLDAAIAAGTVSVADIRRAAGVLARFYREAAPVAVSMDHYRARLAGELTESRRVLHDGRYGLDDSRVRRVADTLLVFLDRQAALFDDRVAAGRVVEGHGDLRPEHVCLLDEPVFIDCLEFDRDLRILDAADELAYLALECERLGAAFVGPVLQEVYRRETGDTVPAELRGFYKGCRALVRARLAAWHLLDQPPSTHGKWLRRTAEYLALAERHAGVSAPRRSGAGFQQLDD